MDEFELGWLASDLAAALVFVGGTIAFALATCLLTRRVAMPRASESMRVLAGSAVFRVGALNWLILAFVFAQKLLDYRWVRSAFL